MHTLPEKFEFDYSLDPINNNPELKLIWEKIKPDSIYEDE